MAVDIDAELTGGQFASYAEELQLLRVVRAEHRIPRRTLRRAERLHRFYERMLGQGSSRGMAQLPAWFTVMDSALFADDHRGSWWFRVAHFAGWGGRGGAAASFDYRLDEAVTGQISGSGFIEEAELATRRTGEGRDRGRGHRQLTGWGAGEAVGSSWWWWWIGDHTRVRFTRQAHLVVLVTGRGGCRGSRVLLPAIIATARELQRKRVGVVY